MEKALGVKFPPDARLLEGEEYPGLNTWIWCRAVMSPASAEGLLKQGPLKKLEPLEPRDFQKAMPKRAQATVADALTKKTTTLGQYSYDDQGAIIIGWVMVDRSSNNETIVFINHSRG